MSQAAEHHSEASKSPKRDGRGLVGVIFVPIVFTALWFSPLGLDPKAHSLAAIFGAVVIAWVTEVIPIAATALLIAPLMVVTGVTTARSAFAPYADPLLFLFVGGFMIAKAMARHGLDRRIALALASAPFVQGRPSRIRMAFMLAGALMSMWISNTATTAILIPILLGTFRDASPKEKAGSSLVVAYACSIGGLGTLVGSPPNLITVRFLDELETVDFGFVEWGMVGLPSALFLLIMTYFVLMRVAPCGEAEVQVRREHTAWSRGEVYCALAFGIAVVGWMVPGIWKATGSGLGKQVAAHLPGGAVALLASSVLFFFRDEEGELVLPWSDANKIDWGIIMLFGGGISLGQQMLETGLANAMAREFVSLTGVDDLWTLTAIVIVFTIFFTEVCSNTASANVLVPIVIAVALETGISPLPPALGVGLAASCAFMLPIATGPNAIAYGTGLIKLPQMVRVGVLLNLLCAIGLFVSLRILFMIYGW